MTLLKPPYEYSRLPDFRALFAIGSHFTIRDLVQALGLTDGDVRSRVMPILRGNGLVERVGIKKPHEYIWRRVR